MDVAGETEIAEIVEKDFAEPAGALEPGDVGCREAKVREEIERLMQPRGQQKSAPRRQVAGEEFENGRLSIAMLQIGLDHVDLIKVRQQRTDLFHCGGLRKLAENICSEAGKGMRVLIDAGGADSGLLGRFRHAFRGAAPPPRDDGRRIAAQ